MAQPSNSRPRILEAAIELIDAHGEVGVKVNDIAEMAEVAKPSLYHFFGSRDGLVIAAQAERYRRSLSHQVSTLLESAEQCTDQHEYATLMLSVITSFAAPEGVLRRRLRIQVLGSAATRPELQAAIREAHQHTVAGLAEVLAIGQRRGWVLSDHTAAELSEWWYSLVTGQHIAEDYGGEAAATGWLAITLHSVSLVLFGTTMPIAAPPQSGA